MKIYRPLIIAGCVVLTYIAGYISGARPSKYEIRTQFRRSDNGKVVRMSKLDGESLQFRLKEAEKDICRGFFWEGIDLIIEPEVVEVK